MGPSSARSRRRSVGQATIALLARPGELRWQRLLGYFVPTKTYPQITQIASANLYNLRNLRIKKSSGLGSYVISIVSIVLGNPLETVCKAPAGTQGLLSIQRWCSGFGNPSRAENTTF
jgi:hypothetical protein